MWRVARHAALVSLDGSVLKHERAHGIGVAFGADGKLACCGADLMPDLRSVGIMAIAALHQSDIDPMTIRTRELSLLRGMASKAQLGLRFDQHEIYIGRFVRTVARGATHSIGEMCRLGEILGFKARLMTGSADRRRLRRTQSLETNDLGDIASTIDVRLPRAVAGLASVLIAFQQRRMRSCGEVLFPDLLMTGLADGVIGILSAGLGRRCRGSL